MEDLIRFTIVAIFALFILWQSFKIANTKDDGSNHQ